QVGEEHGDLLAFTLEPGLRRQDLLGEVLGGVRLGRRESRPHRCRGSAHRGTAPPTELCPRLVQEAAGGTGEGQRGTALGTEPAAGAVGGPTTGTIQDFSAGGRTRMFRSPRPGSFASRRSSRAMASTSRRSPVSVNVV